MNHRTPFDRWLSSCGHSATSRSAWGRNLGSSAAAWNKRQEKEREGEKVKYNRSGREASRAKKARRRADRRARFTAAKPLASATVERATAQTWCCCCCWMNAETRAYWT